MGSILNTVKASALLKKARDQGVSVRFNSDGGLVMRGPKDSAVREELKKHRNHIARLLNEPSKGIKTIIERLQRGQRVLMAMDDFLWDGDGNPKGTHEAVTKFSDALATWDILDMMLREYGEYNAGCPMGPGKCDPKSPVVCRSCGRGG